ncbi:MAG: hypothetical protein ACXWT3_05995 [Methylococcaceae bacterium]
MQDTDIMQLMQSAPGQISELTLDNQARRTLENCASKNSEQHRQLVQLQTNYE